MSRKTVDYVCRRCGYHGSQHESEREMILDAEAIEDIPEFGPTLVISLHTDDPGEDRAHECTYQGYTRQHIPRSRRWWRVEGPKVVNAREILFPQCTSGIGQYVETVRYFAVGTEDEAILLTCKLKPKEGLSVEGCMQPFFAEGAMEFTANTMAMFEFMLRGLR